MKPLFLFLCLLSGPVSADAPDATATAENLAGPSDCRFDSRSSGPEELPRWTGPCKNGYAEGTGVLEWIGEDKKVVSRYEGNLLRGRAHGQGYLTDREGTQYEGEFKEGELDGKGIMLKVDGNHYQGGWKMGRRNGAGSMSFRSGGRYDGLWVADKPHGRGRAIYIGGQEFEGEFAEGLPVSSRGEPAPVPAPAPTYTLRLFKDSPGDFGTRSIASGSSVPYEKGYKDLTPAEKAQVRSMYGMLHPDDEPPYPESGTKAIYTWISEAQQSAQVKGLLSMDVLVDAQGNASSVKVYLSPDEALTKFASFVVMKAKYKPAICQGKPCAMSFPYNIKFSL